MTMQAMGDTIWRTFVSHAESIPDVKAILAPDRAPLSFGELPARLTAIREALNGCGVGRGDIVAGVLPRGPEAAVCLIGVAACATWFPLDPDLTGEELVRYLRRISPKALIVPAAGTPAARRAARELGIMTFELIAHDDQPAGSFMLRPEGRAGDCPSPDWGEREDVAYIVATSGTTSDHKLIPRKHRHLMALARASKEFYRFTVDDLGLHIMPLFHAHGMEAALIVPLLAGSGVACPPIFDIPTFFDNLALFRPTWYSAGFSHHAAILDAVGSHAGIARRSGLRFIRSGSGRLDPAIIRGLEAAFGAPVLERLCMSEAPCVASNPLPPAQRKPGTVGIPICGEVVIMDENKVVLKPGCEGEIVTRGPTVFEGYLDDPETTAAALVDGWFHTGDLGRLDEDGFLTVVGRIKDLINRGGEKIRPREVERALVSHPAIREAAVFPIPHPSLGEIVGAAIVPTACTGPTKRDLMRFLSDRLAPFKIPRDFMVLQEIPKGRTGKIDRRVLTRLHQERAKVPA